MQQAIPFISRYWKLILLGIGIAFILSITVVSLVIGLVTGTYLGSSHSSSNSPKQEIPDKVNILGEWAYMAETSEPNAVFSEDGCKRRLGTVLIDQLESTEIKLNGTRQFKQNCKSSNDNIEVEKQKINWLSTGAAILPSQKEMITFIQTNDNISRFGHMKVGIVIDNNNIKPTQMSGNMYYLNEQNKTWLKSTIKFAKFGSKDAESLQKTYNVKLQPITQTPS